MNLYKEPNKGNPWGISRPVYQFEKTGSANVGTEVGGKMRKELKLLQDDIPAFERYRLEALESFKNKILKSRRDLRALIIIRPKLWTNEVFRYMYDRLGEFFKTGFDFNPTN